MDALTQAWSFIAGFLALLVIGGLLSLFTLRQGKRALVMLVLSLYAGYALYSVFPYTDTVLAAGKESALMLFIVKAALFGALSFVPYLALRRAGGSDFYGSNRLVLVAVSFLAAGFVLALLYHVLGAKAVYEFSPSLDAIFAPAQYFFWWFVAPLAGILLLVR